MRNNRRLRFLLAALGASCLAAAALEAWPSGDEATQKELARALQGGPRGDLASLFARLYAQGDQRGEREIAELILKQPEDGPQLDKIVDLAVRDVWAWNTELPAWKVGVLTAWMRAHHMADTPQGRRFFDRLPVRFSFSDGRARDRLYLEGDWDREGEIATVHGWNAAPMSRGPDGRWTCRQDLRLTRLRHAYHVVVRTAPWPAGRAVGEAAFKISGAVTVAIPPMIGPEAAAAPAPEADPAIGVAVMGIDGGSWDVVLPWVHEGYLPNFARLLERGAVADQVSDPEEDSYPSPANIYSAMTGKLRFRHGMDRGLGGDYFTTSLTRRAAPVWKIASDLGVRSACVNMQGTFPPDALDGEEVSEAFFAANANRQAAAKAMFDSPSVVVFAQFFGVTVDQLKRLSLALRLIQAVMATTSPHALADELGKVLPPPVVRGADLVGLTLSWDIAATAAARYIAGRRRFGLYVTYLTGVDAASHMYWSEIQPPDDDRTPFQAKRGRLFDAYRNADELLGVLLDHSRAVVLFSDHGFGAVAHDVVLPVVDVPRLVDALGRALGGPIRPETAYYQEKSRGVPRQGWTLWLDDPRDQARASRLAELVSGMTYVPQGRPVFEAARVAREHGRVGVRFLEAPMLETSRAVLIGGKPRSVDDVLAVVRLGSSHMANGMFAVAGPRARPGPVKDPVYIVDAAPTILYLAGLPLARDMDGRLSSEAIDPSYLASHPPAYVASYGAGGPAWLRLWGSIDAQRALAALARRF